MLDNLSDDDLTYLASFLAPRGILALSATCTSFRTTLLESRDLWRSLAIALLGEPLVGLHLTAWKASDDARFFRRLVRAGLACDDLAHANKLRSEVVAPVVGSSVGSSEPLKKIINTTGHTASACGPGLVAVIGGWRPACSLPHLHVCVIDVRGRALRVPTVADGSAKPSRRMRHASAVVATPPWATLPAGAPESLPSVLVLGGACDGGGADLEPPPGEERGEPVKGGLRRLTLLSFCDTLGSVVHWTETDASGDAPCAIWHHQAASFDAGARVVVFGGDFPADDHEFEHITDRRNAGHVYVLHVAGRSWERVRTSGARPSWRSLHVGLACRAYAADGSAEALRASPEGLLVLGGSDEHVQPFSSGDCADFRPYILDLATFTWRTSAEELADDDDDDDDDDELRARPMSTVDSFRPTARMRFAAEAYGKYALVYSGHGDAPIPASERLLRLDLTSLTWRRMRVRNAPAALADTPAACLAGGVLVGGVQMQRFYGIRPCPKLDLLCLAEPPEDDGSLGGGAGGGGGGGGGGDGGGGGGGGGGGSGGGGEGGGGGDGSGSGDAGGGGSSSTEPVPMKRMRLWEGGPKQSDSVEAEDAEAMPSEDEADGDSPLVSVEMRGADGGTRTVRLPMELVARLMLSSGDDRSSSLAAMRAALGIGDDDDDDDDEDEDEDDDKDDGEAEDNEEA